MDCRVVTLLAMTLAPYAFQVLLRQRRAKRDRLRDHFRADKQAAARLALRRKARAAEMLAFPLPSLGADNRRLSSLLREECFSGEPKDIIYYNGPHKS